MPTLIDRLIQPFVERAVRNKVYEALFKNVGTSYTRYDTNQETYLERGYLENPIVSAIVKQRADKAKQIPSYVKQIKDERAKKQLDLFNQATKHNPTPLQQYKAKELKNKAFAGDYLPMPLERPNELQTWGELEALYETYIATTGNYYEYYLTGEFSDEPLAVYPLPAHLMQIVLKPNASMLGTESPIDYYMMIEGDRYIKFEADNVLHVKLPNPDYGLNGEHLYGLSPLRAALRNIQSSNLGVDLNNDTMLNGGAFGFIHGMETPLTSDQAESIQTRLKEMRSSKDALGKIRGSSAKLGFTQIRMSAKEMELFNYFDWDEKQIANNLGWDVVLLNNTDRAKYDNVSLAEQRVVVNTILPSLQLLDEARTSKFLPRFKRYQNTIIQHDASDLPEMQQDMKQLVDWLSVSLSDGVINRDTYREFLKLPMLETEEMRAYTVKDDVIPLGEAIDENFTRNDQAGI